MIFRSLAEVPQDFGPCAITIGNFDGVHRGHREIIRRLVAIARERGWHSAALTFDPHPTKLVAPARAPRLLTTPEERARIIEQLGVNNVLILPFNVELAALTPEAFVHDILVDKLKTRAVLVGSNFRFGHRAAGDVGTLGKLGGKFGFETDIVEGIAWRGRAISSTEIRLAIEAGHVALACRMLGRPFALEGKVVHGAGVGSKQTVPTLNLQTSAEVLPRLGVYVTRTRETGGARQWPSITNVGYRPTFNGHGLSIETYLLTGLEGPTPGEIAVEFLRWVREEKKFENAEALKAQILRDVGRAQSYFRRMNGRATPTPRTAGTTVQQYS
jgi:riboflavin kinase/FMN adenylyltransferase